MFQVLLTKILAVHLKIIGFVCMFCTVIISETREAVIQVSWSARVPPKLTFAGTAFSRYLYHSSCCCHEFWHLSLSAWSLLLQIPSVHFFVLPGISCCQVVLQHLLALHLLLLLLLLSSSLPASIFYNLTWIMATFVPVVWFMLMPNTIAS